jgi:hypothetical protein
MITSPYSINRVGISNGVELCDNVMQRTQNFVSL